MKKHRIWEKLRESPGAAVQIDINQMRKSLIQLVDTISRLDWINSTKLKEICKNIKETFDSWTGGRFTYSRHRRKGVTLKNG
jgi:hypothetical protein